MAGVLPIAPLSTFNYPPQPRRSSKPTQTQFSSNSLLLYLETLTLGSLPTKPIFISSIKSCSHLSSISLGQSIHAHIIKSGLQSDKFVATSIITFYSSNDRLAFARQVFDKIPQKDPPLVTAMILAYVENGDIARARALFGELTCKDVIAWNAMLTGYLRCGLPEYAPDLFRDMMSSKVVPNEVTLICALSACSRAGSLELGEWIHLFVNNHSVVLCSTTLKNSIVHMYSKCGKLDVAVVLFESMECKNLESWNTMLTAYAIHGRGIEALWLFSRMIKIGIRPDRISFVAMLMACSHGGMIDHARSCFVCMNRLYGIEPDAKHYNCMVDILARKGCLAEAMLLIKSMPYEADSFAWGALLTGCLTYQSYELGLHVASRLLEMEPSSEGRYTTMLNLYSMDGRMEDATELRKAMAKMCIKQCSGISLIEVDGVVHEFTAGDRSHPRSKDIYTMVSNMFQNLDLHCQLY